MSSCAVSSDWYPAFELNRMAVIFHALNCSHRLTNQSTGKSHVGKHFYLLCGMVIAFEMLIGEVCRAQPLCFCVDGVAGEMIRVAFFQSCQLTFFVQFVEGVFGLSDLEWRHQIGRTEVLSCVGQLADQGPDAATVVSPGLVHGNGLPVCTSKNFGPDSRQ